MVVTTQSAEGLMVSNLLNGKASPEDASRTRLKEPQSLQTLMDALISPTQSARSKAISTLLDCWTDKASLTKAINTEIEKRDARSLSAAVWLAGERRLEGTVQTLTDLLVDDLYMVKTGALAALAKLGHAADSALPVVSCFLGNECSETRAYAALVMEKAGRGALGFFNDLTRVADNDPDSIVREFARRAVEAIALDGKVSQA